MPGVADVLALWEAWAADPEVRRAARRRRIHVRARRAALERFRTGERLFGPLPGRRA